MSFVRGLVLVFLAELVLCVPGVHGAETPPLTNRQPRVLVVYSNERLLPANIAMDEAIRSTFESELDVPVEFYIEFLDVERFPEVEQKEWTRDSLMVKFRERPPDVILAAGEPALSFLMGNRAMLFPGTPLVHFGLPPGDISKLTPDDMVVGIPYEVGAVATLELALRLQPDTRQVAIVDGNNPSFGLDEADVEAMASEVGFLWLTNRSIAQLRDDLSRLPDHTVVLYSTMFRDPAGNAFTPRTALDQFSPASRVPIYGYYDTYLGHGIVGGSMVTFQTIGRSAAEIAIRILKGQRPQEAASGATHPPTPMFDWRQLEGWNIGEDKLPPESVVLHRPRSMWQDHKRTILGGVALLLVEAALIAVLILQLCRRRRAEAVARESEQAARELSGRLIHTQEEERGRIARDLHDDFNQRLALLSVEIDLLARNSSTPESVAKLRQLGEHASELSSDVHRLAYQLHPAKLDQLGLVAAVNALCRDLSRMSDVKVNFTHENVPRELPADLGRCVFRVIQESLNNVVRHSGATEARVELTVQNSHLRLLVSDEGRGFDSEAKGRSAGLGLLSMRERVRLSRGDLEIRSGPGQGTRVELTIPLRPGETVA